jgi:hypothetical protein
VRPRLKRGEGKRLHAVKREEKKSFGSDNLEGYRVQEQQIHMGA